MRTAFIVVHRPSLAEFGEDRFLAVMRHAGVEIRTDEESRLNCNATYWAFRSYGLDACVLLGDIPDHVETKDIHDELKVLLGESFKPIIVMTIPSKREGEE